MTDILTNHFSPFEWLLIARVTALLAMAWIVHLLLHRSNPRWQVWTWRMTCVGLVLVPFLSLALPGWGPQFARPTNTNMDRNLNEVTGLAQDKQRRVTPPEHDLSSKDSAENTLSERLPAESDRVTTAANPTSLLRFNLDRVLVLVYFTVAAFLMLRIILQVIRLHDIFRQSNLATSKIQSMGDDVAVGMGLRTAPVVLMSPHTSVPFVLGIIQPRLVLPESVIAAVNTQQLRLILTHETAHIAGLDLFWSLFAKAVQIILWPHPLIWRVPAAHRLACETLCDGIADNAAVSECQYSQTLAQLALQLQESSVPDCAIAIIGRSEITRRLHRIAAGIRSERLKPSRRFAAVLTGVSVAGVIATAGIVGAEGEAELAGTDKPRSDAVVQESDTGQTKDKSSAEPQGNYTFPINVSGRAIDASGKPISGASIYLSSQIPSYKRIAETKTDDSGRYSFEMAKLPIHRSDTNDGRDNGSFIVFGKANGHGFAWRPEKRFYPKPNPGFLYYDNPERDQPTRYEKDDRIELDLLFATSTRIRGRILDANGNAIAKTELSIWDCEQIPPDGYGPRAANSTRRPFNNMDNEGFGLLNAGVPLEMQICRTDNNGRFEFSDVPVGCRFRIRVRPPGVPARMVWVASQKGLDNEYKGTPLYDSTTEIELTFGIPKNVPVQVVYGDTGKPAPNVYVSAANRKGSTYKSTDKEGRVSLALPVGEYRLRVLPAHGTPYLKTDGKVNVSNTPAARNTIVKLHPAAQVEVQVLDQETGKGISNVDFWTIVTASQKKLHYTTSWGMKTRTVHRHRHRTDENGVIRALFEPGKHRIGVAWRSYPPGYRPVEENGQEIEAVAGKKVKVTFHLRRATQN